MLRRLFSGVQSSHSLVASRRRQLNTGRQIDSSADHPRIAKVIPQQCSGRWNMARSEGTPTGLALHLFSRGVNEIPLAKFIMHIVSLGRAWLTLILGVVVERHAVVDDLKLPIVALEHIDQALVDILYLDFLLIRHEGRPDLGASIIAGALPGLVFLENVKRPAGTVREVFAKGFLGGHCEFCLTIILCQSDARSTEHGES